MQNSILDDTEKKVSIIKLNFITMKKLEHKKMKMPDTAQYPLTIRNQNKFIANYPFLNNLEMSRWNHTEISVQRCLHGNQHTNPKRLGLHVVGANKPVQH